MKIMALDSSGMTASVAILEDDKLVAEYSVNDKKTHSQTLLPMLEEICRMTGQELSSIDAIAVAKGPGSFTGLRIGCAAAKGIGLALDKPLIAVPTLEAMAYSGWGADGLVCPMLDARRGQVYTGIYRFAADKQAMAVVMDQTACPAEQAADRLNELGERVLLLGDGADECRPALEKRLRVPHLYAPATMNRQRAAQVGLCGLRYAAQGKTVTAAQMRPDYLRPSQAERVRTESQAEDGARP